MSASSRVVAPITPALPNGSGASAILSAGIACFSLAVLAIAADKVGAVKTSLAFSKSTGPLSGVSTVAILIWLVTWAILETRWRRKTVGVARVGLVALVLLVLGFLLSFPPIADLF